jgi:hypothetical protein
MALGVRGSNPIWTEVDLQGKLFDDTFYLFVLENTIPYIPAVVYHDPNLNLAWDNPIRFYANGTLPIDIYFEANKEYRLEFRQGNTQSAPLIYLVENYQAGSGGSTPIDAVTFSTSNQITNPQFSLISFVSPYSVSATDPDPIEVAPGWFLELAGTGTATIARVALNDSNINPSNAPYALHLTLNGWNDGEVFLRQRFQQNGMLWANKFVASVVTTRLQGLPQLISAQLIDSNGTPIGDVLPESTVNNAWNELPGNAQILPPTNPDIPPAAYVDYKLKIPSNIDIYLTSFQLIVEDLPLEPAFEQDSIDRQVDHTWHYYKDSVLLMPKDTILTAWNFPLNPWQARTKSNTTILSNTYITDQTILSMENPGSIAVSANSAGELALTTVTATTQQNFAVIQYIDPTTIIPYWNEILSSLVTAAITTTNGTQLNVKMKLIASTALPAAVDPILSWISNEPVFTGQWSVINAINTPVQVISSATPSNFAYEGFQLPVISSSTMTLGIVFYTTTPLGTDDILRLKNISLVPNRFAIASQPQTYDRVLSECQFYYEKSYAQDVVPGTDNAGGCLFAYQTPVTVSTNTELQITGFGFPFKNISRTDNPIITLYSPITLNAPNFVFGEVQTSLNGTTFDIAANNWTELQKSSTGVSFVNNNRATTFLPAGGTAFQNAWIFYHYTKDARLGLVA